MRSAAGTTLCTSPPLSAAAGPDRAAFQHHRQRGHGAHQARQALRAAGAGHQADLGLDQAELDARIVGDDAVVAGEADLQPAAQRQAVDGGDERLAALLDPRAAPG